MYKRYLVVLFTIFGLGISTPSWSMLMIGGNDVGGIDTIVDAISDLNKNPTGCGKGNSPVVEECWADDVSGYDLTYSDKSENVHVIYNGDYTIAAFQLAGGPGHYLVKNASAYVLVYNESDLGWGVLDLDNVLFAGLKLNLGKPDQIYISHVTRFDERKVPEPSIIALFGLGLLGLGFSRRRMRS